MANAFNQILLLDACRRALCGWLMDVGRDCSGLREHRAGSGIYRLTDMRRLVHARAAVAPRHPEPLDRKAVDRLRNLAQRLSLQAWEARILLRTNYHPQAILWRRLDAAEQSSPADNRRPS